MHRLTPFIAALFGFFLLIASDSVNAQTGAVPELPAPLQALVDDGAQIRYLGNDQGLDAWITIKNGQEQYFYVKPDRSAFVMGLLFDAQGKAVTVQQVQKLRASGDGLLDSLAGEIAPQESAANPEASNFDFKSPSERLFVDIENSNWVPLGQAGAPVVYAFIDPQCPHCHEFIQDLRKGFLDSGQIQLRMIPVGFREETRSQAAYLLAAPNPADTLLRYLDGNADALPARAEINQQGVQRNLAILQAWKFDVTPMVIYRAKDGSVKLVRGRPKDVNGLIADIGARS